MEVTKKKEREESGQEGKKAKIDPAIIEELLKGYERPEDLRGPGGIMEELTQAALRASTWSGDEPLFGLRKEPGAAA
jgi:hypothetical protein